MKHTTRNPTKVSLMSGGKSSSVCTRIFVEHVWGSGLHLRLKNTEPQLLGLHRFPAFASGFKLRVHTLELFPPDINETFVGFLVVCFIGTEQCPIPVVFHTGHEEVRNPKSVKQVTCSLLFLAMILFQFKEIEDIC